MTVKCLNDDQKAAIVSQYTMLSMPINQIVKESKRSRRTIIRVLQEAGVDVPIRKRSPKPVVIVETVTVVHPELTPMEYLKCLWKAVFRKSKTNDSK